MSRNQRLRRLIAREEILIAPGVYDAYLASCVERAGFEALYMTGAGVSQARLGMPDLGLLSFAEMVEQAERIADAVDLPVIADADTGYGNAMNVARTIRAYERTGVSACHIEDQQMPKRCGHFDEKRVVPVGEMVAKLKAALDARTDPDFVIIARTDARTVEGLDAALERAQAYIEAGADMIFVESPLSEDELAVIGRTLKVPLLANMVESGKTPIVPAEKLEALGFSVVIHPGSIGRFIGKQVAKFLQQFRTDRSTLSQMDKLLTFAEQNEIVDLKAFLERAKRYRT